MVSGIAGGSPSALSVGIGDGELSRAPPLTGTTHMGRLLGANARLESAAGTGKLCAEADPAEGVVGVPCSDWRGGRAGVMGGAADLVVAGAKGGGELTVSGGRSPKGTDGTGDRVVVVTTGTTTSPVPDGGLVVGGVMVAGAIAGGAEGAGTRDSATG